MIVLLPFLASVVWGLLTGEIGRRADRRTAQPALETYSFLFVSFFHIICGQVLWLSE